jgi:(2Fe-2S) ferredoxin
MKYNRLQEMYGGVLQDPNDPRNNFFNFLNNSSVTLLSNTSNYGIIYKVTISNNSYNSPYSMFRSKHFGEKVKTLVVKICPLVNQYKKNQPILLIGGKEKKTTTVNDFLKEYYTQVFIALDTCKYLESSCPFPVYVDLFKKTNSNNDTSFDDIPVVPDVNINEGSPTDYMFDDTECLQLFKSKFSKGDDLNPHADDDDYGNTDIISHNDDFLGGGSDNILDQLINNLDVKYDYLGIIAMELAEGYNTLKTFLPNSAEYTLYKNYARYELIMLALENRLSHCDFHNENLLINPTYEGYFNEQTGKPLLIDFGLMKYIDDKEYSDLQQLFSQKKYDEFIHNLYEFSIPQPLWEYQGYNWFKNVTSDDINQIVQLITKREEAKRKLETFSREQPTSSNYPQIPLSLNKYQKFLPKISFGLFFGGYSDTFYQPIKSENIEKIMEDILKTISISITSLLTFNNKIYVLPSKKDVPNMIKMDVGLPTGIVNGGKRRRTQKTKHNTKKYTRRR